MATDEPVSPTTVRPKTVSCFVGTIENGEVQRVGYARLTSGIAFELTEAVEFELGLGPIWLHRDKVGEDEDVKADSVGGEAVAELVFWPFAHKSLGFYVESGYSYDFGKGHEKAAGGGAGLLFNIP